ncbi:hypothetical protein DV515_00012745 [Chloebia gouldiae]|uniref:Uncharacterized protein n=1 Tax=Chloebia gouldiae TaxID=44316 RepID=A0A3L8S484_CHLGU|nr:hypothetical protein DV515_00012745 [Chloebia gouldiae]
MQQISRRFPQLHQTHTGSRGICINFTGESLQKPLCQVPGKPGNDAVVKAKPALAVPAALSSNCALMQPKSSSTGLLRGALGSLARQVACAGPIPRQLQRLLSTKEATGCDGFGGRRDTGKSLLPAGSGKEALPHTEGIC